MKKVLAFVVLIVLLAACSQQANPANDVELNAQAGSWQKLGGALDFTVSKNAASPRLFLDRSGSLVAAWQEPETSDSSRTYLERWTGSSWQSFGKIFPVGANFVGFDASNSPVIVQTTFTGTTVSIISRWDATGKTWKQLGGSFTGYVAAVDKNGAVYRIVHDKLVNNSDYSVPPTVRGKNLIQRWNGSVWQTLYTFQKTIDTGGDVIDIPLTSLIFKSDGKPAAYWTYPDSSFAVTLIAWNGTAWVDSCSVSNAGSRSGSVTLDKKDQCLGFRSFGEEFSTFPFQGNKSLLTDTNNPLGDISTITVDNLNRPLIILNQRGSTDADRNLVVQRWTGSVWAQLGGNLDRVATRNAFQGSLITDSKNTLYAIWLECTEIDTNDTRLCKNSNVYVSKYVP
jgi:hypothetical protein